MLYLASFPYFRHTDSNEVIQRKLPFLCCTCLHKYAITTYYRSNCIFGQQFVYSAILVTCICFLPHRMLLSELTKFWLYTQPVLNTYNVSIVFQSFHNPEHLIRCIGDAIHLIFILHRPFPFLSWWFTQPARVMMSVSLMWMMLWSTTAMQPMLPWIFRCWPWCGFLSSILFQFV